VVLWYICWFVVGFWRAFCGEFVVFVGNLRDFGVFGWCNMGFNFG